MDPITPQFLDSLCLKVARKFNSLPCELEPLKNLTGLHTHLIFPKKQKNKTNSAKPEYKLRISEQEARFLFSQEIETCKKGVYYSVETPTEKKYKFKGNKETSASSDLSLFELSHNNEFIKKLNVEFKAHNVDQKQFEKDFKKLLGEQCYQGLFFQVLESINNGTLTIDNKRKGVLSKYKSVFSNLKNDWNQNKRQADWFIHFIIYSHKPALLLSKTFLNSHFEDTVSFFNLKYSVIKQKFSLIEKNGWRLYLM